MELAVIVGDDTTADELRRAWGAIDNLRLQLRRLQGSDMQKFENSLMFGYAQMKAHGWSYKTIAMDINYDCMVNLCRAAEEVSNLEEPEFAAKAFSPAVALLKAMRMKDEEILHWLIPGLEEIHAGNAPWSLESGPVDSQRVRDALRQWQREQRVEQVVIKAPPKTEVVSLEELDRVNQAVQEKADQLLAHSYPDSLPKFDTLTRKYYEKMFQAASKD